MLTSREQLMEDIDAICDEYFQVVKDNCVDIDELSYIDEAQEDLIRVLCDAVCRNFPTK